MTDYLSTIIPLMALSASNALLALGTVQLSSSSFQFWPPPDDQPWKKHLFMTLFRIMVYGVIASSAFYVWEVGLPSVSPTGLLAASLLFIGFCIAFASTLALGWGNAFGSNEGLKTNGIFKYSRNPIYIATWFGLAGWALLIREPLVVATLFNWGLLYVIAIFMEERWLAVEYGRSYHAYCSKVRRFF